MRVITPFKDVSESCYKDEVEKLWSSLFRFYTFQNMANINNLEKVQIYYFIAIQSSTSKIYIHCKYIKYVLKTTKTHKISKS